MEMAPLILSADREEVMDFIAFYTEYSAFLYKIDINVNNEEGIYLMPFQKELWGLIGFVIPFIAIVAHVLTRVTMANPGRPLRRSSKVHYLFQSFKESFTYFFAAACGNGEKFT